MFYIGKEIIAKVKSVLDQNSRFVILTHTNPDGDALGSILALYFFLKALGKEATPITPTPYAGFLKWLPGHSRVLKYHYHKEKIQSAIEQAEVICILDLNDPGRLGELWPLVEMNTGASRILIDHHPDPEHFCPIEISDIRPSSTAELLFDLMRQLYPEPLMNQDLATCIYVGMMTDTGCFSFNSSRPQTFQTVAKLLESGIDKDQIFNMIYNNFSESRMKLMGYALDQKMKVLASYRTAYISLTAKEMERYAFKIGDSEGFVNMPLNISGIHFAALFLEKDKHIKISFRSKGYFSVNEFSARHFNGGGHLNAAGGEWHGTLDEAVSYFESLLPGYNNELNPDD